MDDVKELIRWAKGQGTELHGIKPRIIPGRGVGIVSTRPIKEDECILQVPSSCLKSIDSTQYLFNKLPRDVSTHCVLTLDLYLDDSPGCAKWKAVMPKLNDIATMPILWPQELQDLLPAPAKKALEKQKANMSRDWTVVVKYFNARSRSPTSSAKRAPTYQEFQHCWLLINSRTFYHVPQKATMNGNKNAAHPPLPARDDRMALQPIADLFNHVDEGGCEVHFDAEGFTITADRDYDTTGEELFICYGRHTNDALLVEYGFCLDRNQYDEASLDDVVLRHLAAPNLRDKLRDCGYFEGYVADRRTACFRTEVAARALVSSSAAEFDRFLGDGTDTRETSDRANGQIGAFLHDALDRAEETGRRVVLAEAGDELQRRVLEDRWVQVEELLKVTISMYPVN